MGSFLSERGDRPAVITSDATVTYAELDDRASRWAATFHSLGLVAGDRVAVLLENRAEWFEVYWGAQRLGLYTVPINWHLRSEEVAYIVSDSGARVVVTSSTLSHLVPVVDHVLMVDNGPVDAQVYDGPTVEGAFMFYSSGTTGRPKGIKPPLSGEPFGSGGGGLVGLLRGLYGFDESSVYLCPAPLYHAAPLGWSTAVHRIGGTVVVMDKFDPEQVLQLIEHHRITHAQFVPTHFIRMLRLPDTTRQRYDVSSLRAVVHAAAPCPVPVKRQMLEWWGRKIFEYYAGSEGNGFVAIGPEEWLSHPGSVGRPLLGTLHLLDDDGVEVAAGETGQIWFESATRFEYHNDPTKTASAFNALGWSSLGDIGRVDDDGFLYLTDRASHMIISGGVNIYPQEVENELAVHPAVADVAVIGVPNAEFGEEVKAVVVATDPTAVGAELEAALIAHCRVHLAAYKCPLTVDFVDDLPRLPSGKLLKRELRDRYNG